MQQRDLGTQGLRVSAIGLGCMGMSDFYGSSAEADNLAVLAAALDQGVTFWDTADMYGPWTNEALLGSFFREHPGAREKVQLATKFANMRNEKGEFLGVNGRPEYVKSACEASLKRLGVDCIDLYYQHRIDPEVPIEETVGAMSELVAAGKVRFLGLSEASARTIRRACKVHPITALQSEYSLWSREVEDDILPTCRELGVGFVAYSPLGRGFLTGAIRSRADLQVDDWRLENPRFAEENFHLNLELVDALGDLAAAKGCTPAQLALAWLLAQDPHIVTIPGTRSLRRLAENAGAAALTLGREDLASLERILDAFDVRGGRYPAAAVSLLAGDTPEL
ncbi:aldo/keto reductase [Mangrovimicrobium sediminis]|uniref:Aldo/keto reductase n=1 Tax=Mangrovimicrobium sediminis TaxID=2562682 RepID=A0A4Z0MA83_9GAMM|nr:aldo/keto reductase [Haliea sp. SAOS-164]TGD76215.1 aldo/keto reductase [Haliea sp. SAOS-164]